MKFYYRAKQVQAQAAAGATIGPVATIAITPTFCLRWSTYN